MQRTPGGRRELDDFNIAALKVFNVISSSLEKRLTRSSELLNELEKINSLLKSAKENLKQKFLHWPELVVHDIVRHKALLGYK
ncbi:hypothetical protein [Halomonas sp. BC2]|uniref:hypothetical protein n=1 Tax=Halomonas sp. BC2 TaxID=1670449 RepID=UPI001119D488|nr:hypothetical protein [Halomonas sp. BC2]